MKKREKEEGRKGGREGGRGQWGMLRDKERIKKKGDMEGGKEGVSKMAKGRESEEKQYDYLS